MEEPGLQIMATLTSNSIPQLALALGTRSDTDTGNGTSP
jgi:hypothetical protein